MKKFISLLSGVALLLASASVVSVAAEGEETPAATPARPAANGDVAWAADFRVENQENWVVGSNWKTDGSTEGNLAIGPRHLIKEPTGISDDGLSVTLQAGADDLVAAHRDGQVGGNALLTVDAGELRRVGHISRGHGDDKAQLLHRELKAAEQLDAQL